LRQRLSATARRQLEGRIVAPRGRAREGGGAHLRDDVQRGLLDLVERPHERGRVGRYVGHGVICAGRGGEAAGDELASIGGADGSVRRAARGVRASRSRGARARGAAARRADAGETSARRTKRTPPARVRARRVRAGALRRAAPRRSTLEGDRSAVRRVARPGPARRARADARARRGCGGARSARGAGRGIARARGRRPRTHLLGEISRAR
jgi:hypothetical protein